MSRELRPVTTEIIEKPWSKSGLYRFYTVEKNQPVGTEDWHSPNTFQYFSHILPNIALRTRTRMNIGPDIIPSTVDSSIGLCILAKKTPRLETPQRGQL